MSWWLSSASAYSPRAKKALHNVEIFDIQAPSVIRLRFDVPEVVYFRPSVDELFFVNGYSRGGSMLLWWTPIECRERIRRIAVFGGERDNWHWDPFMELAFGLQSLGKLMEVVFGVTMWPWDLDSYGVYDKYGHDPDRPREFQGPVGAMWFGPVKRLFPEWKEPRMLLGHFRNDIRDGAESLLVYEKTLEERWRFWQSYGAREGEIDRVCNSFEDFTKKCKEEEAIAEATVTVESVGNFNCAECTCWSTDSVRGQCKCRTG